MDVEDWPQSVLDRSLPIGDYCADNTRRILELLAEYGVRGTFFVLGKFAERHPGVVREIDAGGHEVACHGWGHEEVFRLGPRGFREDLRRATGLLADLSGRRPLGYRAPVFSIVRETLWALEMLAEEGYSYDSSIYPFDNGRYGIGDWPIEATRVPLPGGQSIVEFPLTVRRMPGWPGRLRCMPGWPGRRRCRNKPTAKGGGRSPISGGWPLPNPGGWRLPTSGGGYARLLPGWLLRRWLAAEARCRAVPPVFYCHPYELDPGEFRRLGLGLGAGMRQVLRMPLGRRLHQGLGRRGSEGKLRRILAGFECVPFSSLAPVGGAAVVG